MRIHVASTVLVALAACGGGDDKLVVAITPEHVTAVNALVPAAWKDKLAFEAGTVVDRRGREAETYRLARPSGWVPAFMPGTIKPADADDFGRSERLQATMQMRVGTNCDGECIEKNWAEISDRVNFAAFTKGELGGRIVKDERTDTGRTVVFAREPRVDDQGGTQVTTGTRGVNLMRVWWKKGGKRYYSCEVELGEQLSGPPPAPLDTLIPAFEAACSLVSSE